MSERCDKKTANPAQKEYSSRRFNKAGILGKVFLTHLPEAHKSLALTDYIM